jgi:hypothetical protein
MLVIPNVYGQASDGAVTGAVADASGAAIPNVGVELENIDTGVKQTANTNQNGVYRFNNVPIGRYRVTAVATGFAATKIENATVELNRTTTVNLTLQVANVSSTVEVVGATAPIDTTTAQVQSTFSAKTIVDMPMSAVGLGPLNVSLLSAGVASSGGLGLGEGPSVGGQRPRNNSFNVEGVDNNRRDVTGSNLRIPNEATAEVTILQNQFSAEFGHSGGGVFNTVVRSGTNELHGSVYEYFQNRNLNALDQAFARQGIYENPRYDDNRLGGSIGGPIIRNKLFYYGLFEYNPIGQASSPSTPTYAPTDAGYQRLASIPGLSQTNLNVLKQYAGSAPTASDTTSVNGVAIPIGILPISLAQYQNNYNWVVSGDYVISDADQLRVRFLSNKATGFSPLVAPNLPAFAQLRDTTSKLFSASYFHTFTPSLTNEFRFGYNRYNDNIPAGNFSFPGLDAFPNILIQNDLQMQIGPFENAPQSGILNTYQGTENINWIKGNHTLKLGGEFRKYITSTFFTQRVRGDYEYSNLERYLSDLTPDLLAQRNLGATPYNGNAISHYWYANDSWRMRRNVTVNLGLRYEYKGIPFGDKQQAVNAGSSVPGLIEFREPKAQLTNFAPRVGVAWSPGSSGLTSIRAGFGMGYDNYPENFGNNNRPPQFSTTVDDDTSRNDPNYLQNGGIAPSRRPPTLSQADAIALTSAYIPDQHLPYSVQWNVGVQHVFAKDYTAEVRYLGTRGVRLFMQVRENVQALVKPDRQLPTYYQRPSQGQLDSLPLTLDDLLAPGFFKPQWAAAGFDQTPIVAFENRGNSIYHGLATELTRRFSKGLLFKAAYTWSKTIDDSTADLNSTAQAPRRAQDFDDLRAERSRSFLDRTHRFTYAWSWDVPWLKNSNWAAKNLIGNWLVAGAYIFESPQWVTAQSGIDSNLNNDSAADRTIINLNGTPGTSSAVTALKNSAGKTVAYLANDPTAYYIQAGRGAYPNGGRMTLPLSSINNWDLNVTKRFGFGEHKALEFRGYFYNLFNHPMYTAGYVNDVGATPLPATVRANVLAGNPLFNDPSRVFSSSPRSLQLVARFVF